MTPNVSCEVCQTPFYGSPGHLAQGWARFCSRACRAIKWTGSGNPRWSAQGECLCEECGRDFHRKPSHVQKGEGRFCSWVCRRKAHSVSSTCPHCGVVFSAYKSLEQVYCSQACQRAALQPQWNRSCQSCGKWFYVKPGELKRVDKVHVGRFCSMACKARGMTQRHHPAAGKRAKSGKRPDLNDQYFRSAWEANWARYLRLLQEYGEIQSWAFEPETFEFHRIKRGSRFYTPDFRLVNRDGSVEYHEVKGWMDQRSQTKLNRMRTYYPQVKVVLVERAAYTEVARKLGRMIPGWEWERNLVKFQRALT